MPTRLTTTELDYAAELYLSGQSFDKVATTLGRKSSEGIRIALKRRGIKARPKAGRPAHNRMAPPDDLTTRFKRGDSVLAISEAYGVARGTVARWLDEAGCNQRTASEATTIRMGRLSPDERSRQTQAAHARIQAMERPDDWQEAIARGREHVQYGGRTSPGTDALCRMLTAEKILHVREKAIGRYNVDIALPTPQIAVEVLGGNWHGSKEIHRRRTPYILNEGWHMLFVWATKGCKVSSGAFKDLVTYAETLRLDPPASSQYRVIRGDGKVVSAGGADDDEFPLVPPSRANLD